MPSRKRQILSSDVQKHQGQSVWLADLWRSRHMEPGCVLDGHVWGGTEMTFWIQGQSSSGVNTQSTTSRIPAPLARPRLQPVSRTWWMWTQTALQEMCIRGPERQLSGVPRQARWPWFSSRFCSLLGAYCFWWPWAQCFTARSLSFLLCKMGISIAPAS